MATQVKNDVRSTGLTGDVAPSDEQIDGIECSQEELREFLSADVAEVHADPQFKERLRLKLWGLLKTRGPDGV